MAGRGLVLTGEVGLDGVGEVRVPEVAVLLAELHLVQVRLRRRHRRVPALRAREGSGGGDLAWVGVGGVPGRWREGDDDGGGWELEGGVGG